jgi:hypothetical protein
LLEKREGIERTGFRAWDAEAAAEHLRRQGIAVTGPQDFARPVELPGDGFGEAQFRTIQWPLDRAPAGMRIFAVQHLTPEMVWLPVLQRHANSAQQVRCVEVLADEPARAAAELAELIGASSAVTPDGAHSVQTAPDRAAILYLDRAGARARYPEEWLIEFREAGGLAITLEASDLGVAARETGGRISDKEDRVSVPPNRTSGVILNFVSGARPVP